MWTRINMIIQRILLQYDLNLVQIYRGPQAMIPHKHQKAESSPAFTYLEGGLNQNVQLDCRAPCSIMSEKLLTRIKTKLCITRCNIRIHNWSCSPRGVQVFVLFSSSFRLFSLVYFSGYTFARWRPPGHGIIIPKRWAWIIDVKKKNYQVKSLNTLELSSVHILYSNMKTRSTKQTSAHPCNMLNQVPHHRTMQASQTDMSVIGICITLKSQYYSTLTKAAGYFGCVPSSVN